MKETEDFATIEGLFSIDPYSLSRQERERRLLEALNLSFQHHFVSCPAYRKFCERRGFNVDSRFESFDAFPFIPVQAFKENADLLQSVEASKLYLKLQSSATSGVPSTVHIDKVTSKRQVKALASVISAALGGKRRPFFVLDLDAKTASPTALGARAAAVRGFLNLARETSYFMDTQGTDGLALKEKEFVAALETASKTDEPVAVLGFTYVLFLYAILPLYQAGKRFKLPAGSKVIHIGGWKKLEDSKVSKAEFNRIVGEFFSIPESNVVDFYGFTEQMGVTYPDSPEGLKHAPVFSEVIVRDPVSFKPLPDGEVGILQFLSPLPHSYPGLSILTDDLGVIVGRDQGSCEWGGTRFRILGRAKKAEVRGCGDIMGDKVATQKNAGRSSSIDRAVDKKVRLLFGAEASYVGDSPMVPVELSKLPEVEDIDALVERLRKGRELLDQYSVDDLIALVSEAAKRWASPTSPLLPLRQSGLLFLTSWCSPTALRQTADRSLHGMRSFLDHFRASRSGGRQWLIARPRGLVAHWLAGNVPLLGMLSLAQAIISKNANILKAPSTFSSVMPLLLDAFRGLELKLHSGRVLKGDDILQSIAVIYFDRENQAAAEALSRAADLRLAWGGREAVETIMNLPKRYGTEDIVFGPKLSFMAIGREQMSNERLLKKVARAAATDASVFDQYACASPHTIFVEKGALGGTPRDFAARLAVEMEKALLRIPKAPPDSGTVGEINRRRMRYEFTRDVWSSSGSEWTVLFDEDWQEGLAPPCYSRVITVRAIDNIIDAAQFAHSGIQTVGLALEGARRFEFAEKASALGAERFPDIGRMTFFDSPWDGQFPMERMVRWVSLGGPT